MRLLRWTWDLWTSLLDDIGGTLSVEPLWGDMGRIRAKYLNLCLSFSFTTYN
jgi:hypothetical protein